MSSTSSSRSRHAPHWSTGSARAAPPERAASAFRAPLSALSALSPEPRSLLEASGSLLEASGSLLDHSERRTAFAVGGRVAVYPWLERPRLQSTARKPARSSLSVAL